ncbi:hypothetical protein AVEN_195842-1 [Araneus ventricosus]|uniref:Uncharacterized protein n=1 Tax=Araneus ventricosus TaxID=182803 RepID=A0A4Y2F473_ARAVE|nr:hypothetical protein AVEN_195842-1 [Araneus ventricosus]
MKKRSYDVPTLLKAKPLMFFKVKKICPVPTPDAEGIACACAIRRSCELTNQSDSTCVRWYHGIESPVLQGVSYFQLRGCIVVRTNLPAPWRTKERKETLDWGVRPTLGDGRKRNGSLP